MLAGIESVADLPVIPSSDTSTSSAGNSDSTPSYVSAVARSVSSSSLNSRRLPLSALAHAPFGSFVGISGAARSTSGFGPASSGVGA
jgi:hypothetical protein